MKKAIRNWVNHLRRNEGMPKNEAMDYIKSQLSNPIKKQLFIQAHI
jgi:hypothetical protein